MKKCTKCGLDKKLESFCRNKASKDGLRSDCSECRRVYRELNSERRSAYNAKYHQEHKEERKVYHDQYRKENQDKIIAYSKTPMSRASLKRSEAKYPNAFKSRKSYNSRKSKFIILDHCQICGSNKTIQAHHGDYNKPMDVEYLCKRCHTDWHMINEPLNRVTGIFTEKTK